MENRVEELVISVTELTKDYGHGRGIFNVSLEVRKGEIFGFLGPNGAGKTTTIRHILGFSKAGSGSCRVKDFDCWTEPEKVQNFLGYVPGEIQFPDGMNGWQFIKQIAEMRGVDLKRAQELCEYFQLAPGGKLKRMSKGMKQKIALVLAFMHDPEILILDEPTSGLDPLMQAKFCELIAAERARGKTILMSSHMFDEIEKTCDRVAIIKQGQIIAEVDMKEIEHTSKKQFEIRFKSKADVTKFSKSKYEFTEINLDKNRVKVFIQDIQINEFLTNISKYQVEYISEIKFTLEKYFMNYYKDSNVVQGGA